MLLSKVIHQLNIISDYSAQKQRVIALNIKQEPFPGYDKQLRSNLAHPIIHWLVFIEMVLAQNAMMLRQQNGFYLVLKMGIL